MLAVAKPVASASLERPAGSAGSPLGSSPSHRQAASGSMEQQVPWSPCASLPPASWRHCGHRSHVHGAAALEKTLTSVLHSASLCSIAAASWEPLACPFSVLLKRPGSVTRLGACRTARLTWQIYTALHGADHPQQPGRQSSPCRS